MKTISKFFCIGLLIVTIGSPISSMAGELTALAGRLESVGGETRLPAKLALVLLKQNQVIVGKADSLGTTTPLDVRGAIALRKNEQQLVIFTVMKDVEGRWYLTDDNGQLIRIAYIRKGNPFQELPLSAENQEAFRKEKASWLERYRAGLIQKD